MKFVFESTGTRHINHVLKDQDITGGPEISAGALCILYVTAYMVILFFYGFYFVCGAGSGLVGDPHCTQNCKGSSVNKNVLGTRYYAPCASKKDLHVFTLEYPQIIEK